MADISTDRLAVLSSLGRGRGVFARVLFRTGDVIESCPIILLKNIAEQDDLKGIGMDRYVFEWWAAGCLRFCVVLGFGSLYNHSPNPNAHFIESSNLSISFVALSDIQPGDEVFINYNGDDPDWKDYPMPFQVV